ncbi:MAG: universal stress protein [Eggerthellaceae bacterium]
MGSRGLGALRGILGSVSSYVLRNADVPVLIVKEGTNE